MTTTSRCDHARSAAAPQREQLGQTFDGRFVMDKVETGQWRRWKDDHRWQAFAITEADDRGASYRYLGGVTYRIAVSTLERQSTLCGRLESLRLEFDNNPRVVFQAREPGFTTVLAGGRTFSFANDDNPIDGKAPFQILKQMVESALRMPRPPEARPPVGASCPWHIAYADMSRYPEARWSNTNGRRFRMRDGVLQELALSWQRSLLASASCWPWTRLRDTDGSLLESRAPAVNAERSDANRLVDMALRDQVKSLTSALKAVHQEAERLKKELEVSRIANQGIIDRHSQHFFDMCTAAGTIDGTWAALTISVAKTRRERDSYNQAMERLKKEFGGL